MKNQRQLLAGAIVLAILIPQITFAAWWNPFTWRIFNKKQEVKIEQPVPSESATSSVVVPNKVEKPAVTTEKAKPVPHVDNQGIEIEKLKKEIEALKQEKERIEVIRKLQGEVEILKKESVQPQTATTKNIEPQKTNISPPANIAPSNSISCNSRYWNPCPTGRQFYCPTSGDAQCLLDSTQNQDNLSQNEQQIVQELKAKTASIESSFATLTQLENNRSKSMQDSYTETERLNSLLGGSDHYDILREISVQEGYRRLLVDECVSKQIRIIDNLLVDVRAVLRIPNLPFQTSSLMNQVSDMLILKRNRLLN